MDTRPLAVQLGEFVAGLRFDDLPPAVVDKAKACVNHALTVGMVGHGWLALGLLGAVDCQRLLEADGVAARLALLASLLDDEIDVLALRAAGG